MKELSRKIPAEYDNPIDNIILDNVEKLNPIFKKFNFTPNMITTLSLIAGLITLYLYKKNKFILAGSFFGLSYFFDCMDGNYARTYKMESKFGDLYDHIKDVSIVVIFLFLFITKEISTTFKLFCITLIFISYCLMCIHMNYTEMYIKKNTKHENSVLKDIFCLFFNCSADTDKQLKNYRYFGCGSFNFIIILCIFLHIFLRDIN